MNYILKMPFYKAIKLINKAREENQRDKLFLLYTAVYPNMDEKTYLSFEDYLEKLTGSNTSYDMRSKDEIMKEMNEIEQKFEDKN